MEKTVEVRYYGYRCTHIQVKFYRGVNDYYRETFQTN